MPISISFWRHGNRPQNSVVQTDECNVCKATLNLWRLNNLAFDTLKDAITVWMVFRQQMVKQLGEEFWTKLWNAFRCTNGKSCPNKRSCGPRPTWMDVGVLLCKKGDAFIWVFYVELAREIMCPQLTGEGPVPPQGPDDTPEIPVPNSEDPPPVIPGIPEIRPTRFEAGNSWGAETVGSELFVALNSLPVEKLFEQR